MGQGNPGVAFAGSFLFLVTKISTVFEFGIKYLSFI